MCAPAERLSVSSQAARRILSVSLLFAPALLEPGTAHFFCPSLSPHFSTVLLFLSGFLVLHYICLGVESFSVTPTRGPLHYMRQGLTTLVFCNLFCPRTAPIFQNYTYIPELPLYPRTASIQNWPHFLELLHISELPPYFRATSIFQNCPHIPELPPYSRTAPIFQNCTYIPSLYLLKFMKSWILFTD